VADKSQTMGWSTRYNKTFRPGLLPIVVGTAGGSQTMSRYTSTECIPFPRTKTCELRYTRRSRGPPVVFDKVAARQKHRHA